MTISFKTGSSGWANYVTEGTAQKPRNKELIEVIENDPFFIEKIASQNKFSGEYYKGVLSAEKKLSNAEMIEMWEEFKKELFVGYKEDEYTIAGVLHQDTERTHIHFCVPKQNLLTGQHLQLYMHGVDTKRMDLIADTIALKHNLKTKAESKSIVKKSKEYSFEKQRAERNQEPFTFTIVTKKDEAMAKQQVTELLKENIQSINSMDEVKEFIEANTDLKVVKADFDRTKKFHYITIQDTANKKVRVQGDLFSEDFFKQPKQEQMQQLQVNHKTFTEVEREAYAKQVRANLKREREKRYKKVQQQGRKLKLSIRQEQRKQNNTIRKEDENTTTTTRTSPERSREPDDRQRRQQSPTLTESAIQKQEQRNRTLEKARQARERVLEEFRSVNSDIQERYRSNTEDIQREYEQQHSKFARELFGAIKTAITAIKSRVENLFIKTPIAEEKAQIAENIKPQEATQSLKTAEESATTVESPQSKEELQEAWEKLVKSAKKLTHSNPKLS